MKIVETIADIFDSAKTLVTTGVAALALVSGASAQGVFTTNLPNGITTGTTNLLFNFPCYITGVTVTAGANTGGTNVNLAFYDANTATNQYVTSAYTNAISIKTNFISVFTNSLGVLQTNKYAGLWTTNNPVAAATNTLPIIYAVNIPPNTSSVNNGLKLLTTKGLSLVQGNSISNATLTIYYVPFP